MALYCQNMFEMAVELSAIDPHFDAIGTKFAEHFFWIGNALNRTGDDGMWDEEDGFYYDVLRTPDGKAKRLNVRSLVGLLPLAATTIVEPYQRDRVPKMMAHLEERIRNMPQLAQGVHLTGKGHYGHGGRGIAALVNPERLRRILRRMLDESEFLSPHGLRSISRSHAEQPFVLNVGGREYRVGYLPAESDSGLFGGNSNWRGPVWLPINALIIRALLHFYLYYGDTFRVECPTGSGRLMNLFDVAKEIGTRLSRIFLRDAAGRRPVFGDATKMQTDPHWRDCILFYEYFHGDNGAGIGANHQTGWTGLVAKDIEMFSTVDAKQFLEGGLRDAFRGNPGPGLGRERQ
jgi:hypothetical protein